MCILGMCICICVLGSVRMCTYVYVCMYTRYICLYNYVTLCITRRMCLYVY